MNMINDMNLGKKFDVIIPHPTSKSRLNAIVVGERILQKDVDGFFVKFCPMKFARDGKLRNLEYKNGTILVKTGE